MKTTKVEVQTEFFFMGMVHKDYSMHLHPILMKTKFLNFESEII